MVDKSKLARLVRQWKSQEIDNFNILLEREQYYLDLLSPFTCNNIGYNVNEKASGVVGLKWTEEQKAPKGTSIDQYDMDGNYIKTHRSLALVERELGIGHSKISLCIHGYRRSAGNYQWVLEGTEAPIKYVRTNLPRKIDMYDADGTYLRTFDSSYKAAKYLFPDEFTKVIEKKAYSISRCCKGIRKTAFSFIWKWK